MDFLLLDDKSSGGENSAVPGANTSTGRVGRKREYSLVGGVTLLLLAMCVMGADATSTIAPGTTHFIDVPTMTIAAETHTTSVGISPQVPVVHQASLRTWAGLSGEGISIKTSPLAQLLKQLPSRSNTSISDVNWNHAWRRRTYVENTPASPLDDTTTRDGLIGGLVTLAVAMPLLLMRLLNVMVARALARELERQAEHPNIQLQLVRDGIERHPGPCARQYSAIIRFIENLTTLDACLSAGILDTLGVDLRIGTLLSCGFSSEKRGTRTVSSLAKYAQKKKFLVSMVDGKVNWHVPNKIWDLVLGNNKMAKKYILAFLMSRGVPHHAEAVLDLITWPKRLNYRDLRDSWTDTEEMWHWPNMRYGTMVSAVESVPGTGRSKGAIVAQAMSRICPANLARCEREYKLLRDPQVLLPTRLDIERSRGHFGVAKRVVPIDGQMEYWSYRTWLLQLGLTCTKVLRSENLMDWEMWYETDVAHLGDLLSATVCVKAPVPTDGSINDWPLYTVLLRETWSGGLPIDKVPSTIASEYYDDDELWEVSQWDGDLVMGRINQVSDYAVSNTPLRRKYYEFKAPSMVDVRAILALKRPLVDILPLKVSSDWEYLRTDMELWCTKALKAVRLDGKITLEDCDRLPRSFIEVATRPRGIVFDNQIAEVFFCMTDYLTFRNGKGQVLRPKSTRDLLAIEGIEVNPGPCALWYTSDASTYTAGIVADGQVSGFRMNGGPGGLTSADYGMHTCFMPISLSTLRDLIETRFTLVMRGPTASTAPALFTGRAVFSYTVAIGSPTNAVFMEPINAQRSRTTSENDTDYRYKNKGAIVGLDSTSAVASSFTKPGLSRQFGRITDPDTGNVHYIRDSWTVMGVRTDLTGQVAGTTASRIVYSGLIHWNGNNNDATITGNEFFLSGSDFSEIGKAPFTANCLYVAISQRWGSVDDEVSGYPSNSWKFRLLVTPVFPRYYPSGTNFVDSSTNGYTLHSTTIDNTSAIDVTTGTRKVNVKTDGDTLSITAPSGVTLPISAAAAIPVSGTVSINAAASVPVTVSGTVATSLGGVSAGVIVPVSFQSSSVMTVSPANDVPFWTSDVQPAAGGNFGHRFDDGPSCGQGMWDTVRRLCRSRLRKKSKLLTEGIEPNPGPDDFSLTDEEQAIFNAEMLQGEWTGMRLFYGGRYTEVNVADMTWETGRALLAKWPDNSALCSAIRTQWPRIEILDTAVESNDPALVDSDDYHLDDASCSGTSTESHRSRGSFSTESVGDDRRDDLTLEDAMLAYNTVSEILIGSDPKEIYCVAAKIVARYEWRSIVDSNNFHNRVNELVQSVLGQIANEVGVHDESLCLNSTTPANPFVKPEEDKRAPRGEEHDSNFTRQRKLTRNKLSKEKRLKKIIERFANRTRGWQRSEWLLWLTTSPSSPQWKKLLLTRLGATAIGIDIGFLIDYSHVKHICDQRTRIRLEAEMYANIDMSFHLRSGATRGELFGDEQYAEISKTRLWNLRRLCDLQLQLAADDKSDAYYAVVALANGLDSYENPDGRVLSVRDTLTRYGIEANPGPPEFVDADSWLKSDGTVAERSSGVYSDVAVSFGVMMSPTLSSEFSMRFPAMVSACYRMLNTDGLGRLVAAAVNDSTLVRTNHLPSTPGMVWTCRTCMAISKPVLTDLTTAFKPMDATAMQALTGRVNAINVVLGMYEAVAKIITDNIRDKQSLDMTMLYYKALRYYSRRQFNAAEAMRDVVERGGLNPTDAAMFTAPGRRADAYRFFGCPRTVVAGGVEPAYAARNFRYFPMATPFGVAVADVAYDLDDISDFFDFDPAEEIVAGARSGGHMKFYNKATEGPVKEVLEAWGYIAIRPNLVQANNAAAWAAIQSESVRTIIIPARLLLEMGNIRENNRESYNLTFAMFMSLLYPELGITVASASWISGGGAPVNGTEHCCLAGRIHETPHRYTVFVMPIIANESMDQAGSRTAMFSPQWGPVAVRATNEQGNQVTINAGADLGVSDVANARRFEISAYLASWLPEATASNWKRLMEVMWHMCGDEPAWKRALDLLTYTMVGLRPPVGIHASTVVANVTGPTAIAEGFSRAAGGIDCYPLVGAAATTTYLTSVGSEIGYDTKFKPRAFNDRGDLIVPVANHDTFSAVMAGLVESSESQTGTPWQDYKTAFVTGVPRNLFSFLRADAILKMVRHLHTFDKLPYLQCFYNAVDADTYQFGGLIGAGALAAANGDGRWRRNGQTKNVGNMSVAVFRGRSILLNSVSVRASEVEGPNVVMHDAMISARRTTDRPATGTTVGAAGAAASKEFVQLSAGAGDNRLEAANVLARGYCPILALVQDPLAVAGRLSIRPQVDRKPPVLSPLLYSMFIDNLPDSAGLISVDSGYYVDGTRSVGPSSDDRYMLSDEELKSVSDGSLTRNKLEAVKVSYQRDRSGGWEGINGFGGILSEQVTLVTQSGQVVIPAGANASAVFGNSLLGSGLRCWPMLVTNFALNYAPAVESFRGLMMAMSSHALVRVTSNLDNLYEISTLAGLQGLQALRSRMGVSLFVQSLMLRPVTPVVPSSVGQRTIDITDLISSMRVISSAQQLSNLSKEIPINESTANLDTNAGFGTEVKTEDNQASG